MLLDLVKFVYSKQTLSSDEERDVYTTISGHQYFRNEEFDKGGTAPIKT